MDNIRIAIWGVELYGVFLKTAFDILKPEGLELVCYSTDNPDESTRCNTCGTSLKTSPAGLQAYA